MSIGNYIDSCVQRDIFKFLSDIKKLLFSFLTEMNMCYLDEPNSFQPLETVQKLQDELL